MNFNKHSQDDNLIVARLNSLDKKIGELKSSLGPIWALKRCLEQELAANRASRAPIRRLPTELLVSIFEETLHGSKIVEEYEEVTSNIVDLILVCNAWYKIIMGVPKIWSKLEVEVRDETFGPEWVSRKAGYVNAFMERSGKMPVDVSLDFSYLSSGEEYLRRKVEYAMDGLMRGVTSEGNIQVKFNYDYDSGMDERWQECLIGLYEGLNQKLVSSIIGKDGAHMKRWKSLQLTLPDGDGDEELATTLLAYLDYPAPQLRGLEVMSWGQQIRWEQHSLRELSTLDRVVLCGPFMPSQIPKIIGARTVILRFIHSLDGIDRVLSFSNVRYLRLHAQERTICPIFHPFTLPHLQTLWLGGYIPDSLFRAFKINHLPELIINCFGEGSCPGGGRLGYLPYPTTNWFKTVDIVNIISPEPYFLKSWIESLISNLAGLFKQLSITSRIGVGTKS